MLKIFNKNNMYIKYRAINKSDIDTEGYSTKDQKIVAKRYLSTSKDIKFSDYLNIPNIQDFVYFLKEDCHKEIKSLRQLNVLDVGCGSGMHSKLFDYVIQGKKVKYTGCEISKEVVDVCKKINPSRKFFISYADKIVAKDGDFNMVFSSSVLHYTLEKWKKSLKEMTRVTSKYLLLTRFPISKYDKSYYVNQTVNTVYGRENHYFIVLNRKTFEGEVASLGLKILARDYSQEMYPVEGKRERPLLCQYLLSK